MIIPSVGDRVMPKRDHGRYIRKNKWYDVRRVDEYKEDSRLLGYQVQVLDEDGDTYWLKHDAYRMMTDSVEKTLIPIGQNNYRMSQQAYGKILEKAGYKKLGNGAFGYVYAKEGSDKVIKLGGIDDGWLSYGKMVLKKHKDNPHAPKIDYIKVMHEGVRPWYMAKMERLYHLYDEGDKYKEARNLYGHLISFAFEGEGRLSARGREWYVKARKKKMLSSDLFSLVTDIKSDIYPFFSQDLNANNAMARADGTLVLTDPAAGQYNRDHRRKAKSRARSNSISMDGQT